MSSAPKDSHSLPWTLETMEIINRLTPGIEGKAFDPDWFLLRQRFEAMEMEGKLDMTVETQSDVDALVQDALQKALTALENSQPKMSHYPEPRERHNKAIELVRKAIKESGK